MKCMMMPLNSLITTTLVVVSLLVVFGSASEGLSPQCLEEIRVLQSDHFLAMVQTDLYDSYYEDFTRLCDFKDLTHPECGLEFDGNNKTFLAACEDKGGKVLTREVVFQCGYSIAEFNVDLGVLPTCIGKSCNASAVQPHELNDTRVEAFLKEISVTGCDADIDSAASATPLFLTAGWVASWVIGSLAFL